MSAYSRKPRDDERSYYFPTNNFYVLNASTFKIAQILGQIDLLRAAIEGAGTDERSRALALSARRLISTLEQQLELRNRAIERSLHHRATFLDRTRAQNSLQFVARKSVIVNRICTHLSKLQSGKDRAWK